MSTLDDLKERFFKFRKHKYAVLLGLALAFVVCSLLLVFAGYLLCFGLLLVALAGYYIPYFFGLKSKKKLAAWGIILIVLLSVPFSISYIESQKSLANTTQSTTDGAMVDGKLTPIYGNSSTDYTFSILVKDVNITQVNIIIADYWTGATDRNVTMTSTDVAEGRLFTYSTTLQNNTEYAHFFKADNGQKWVMTSGNYGPIQVSDSDLYIHWLPTLMLALFIQVGVLYFLLLGLSYMSERSKAKVAEMEKQYGAKGGKLPPSKDGKDEKFVCSECGADVPSSADKCPQCGDKFDDAGKAEEAKTVDKGNDEFVCTDCGAKVDESAKKCWNCGKEFEN